MQQWRVIYDQHMEGAANMAADEALLHAVANKQQPPTLRFYGWDPFCLSLGYGQRLRDVDLNRVQARGWHVVRRPTGGRAILHGDEITYSLTLPDDHPLAAGGIIETYLRISRGLLLATARLGLNVQADPEGDASAKQAGPVCFEVPSKYEITVNGKKLIGSAQLRRNGGVLQHGTLPLYGDIARICDALAYDTDAERDAARHTVRERATTLQTEGINVTWGQAAAALADSLSEALAVELVVGAMSSGELQAADNLYRERYTSQAWNAKR